MVGSESGESRSQLHPVGDEKRRGFGLRGGWNMVEYTENLCGMFGARVVEANCDKRDPTF